MSVTIEEYGGFTIDQLHCAIAVIGSVVDILHQYPDCETVTIEALVILEIRKNFPKIRKH